MKGVVFNEFLELVEKKFGLELVDRIIQKCDLREGGSYTSVGTYHHNELLQLVTQLSLETGISVPDLVKAFGHHLFGQFSVSHPEFFQGIGSAFQFLASVDEYIHQEVLKLYPEAELPHIECNAENESGMELVYKSKRPFGDLAEGLILGCIEHFGEKITIEREELPSEEGGSLKFTLSR